MPDDRSPLARAVAAVLIAVTVWVALHRLVAGDFAYVIWSDRDLVRSAVPFLDLPTSGAELSYGSGARIPGGAYHLLLWLAGKLSADPAGVWRVQAGLDALAAAVLGLGVGRRFGLLAGAVAAAGMLGADASAATQERLWNPAWLPLFAAVATVAWLRVVVDRDARALVVWGVAIALGAQMHVTALLLVPAMLPMVWAARVPGAGRWLAAAAIGAALTWAPYLVSELSHGWPNTRLLLRGDQLADGSGWVSGDARPLQTAWETLRTLAGGGAVGRAAERLGVGATAVGLVAPALVVGVLAALVVRGPRRGARARVLAGLTLAIALETALFARSRYFAMGSSDTTRYLLALSPVAATLLGVAGATAARTARTWGGLAEAAVVLLLGASMTVRLLDVEQRTVRPSLTQDHWKGVTTWIDGTTRATGWTLDQVAGKVVVADATGPRQWTPAKATPIDALLRARGLAFPGSLPPPCGLVLPTPPADGAPLDDAAVAATLGDGVVAPTLDAVHPVGHNLTLVVYHPAAGRCPTTMSNRYLLTPEEALSRAGWASTPPGTARRLADERDTRRWLLNVDLAAGRGAPLPMPALLEIRPAGADQEVVLHANLLRGYAWNGDFFANGDADHPRLIATYADGTRVVTDLAVGRVGSGGELTPLRVAASVPDSARLVFAIDVQPQRAWDPQAARTTPVTVELDLP